MTGRLTATAAPMPVEVLVAEASATAEASRLFEAESESRPPDVRRRPVGMEALDSEVGRFTATAAATPTPPSLVCGEGAGALVPACELPKFNWFPIWLCAFPLSCVPFAPALAIVLLIAAEWAEKVTAPVAVRSRSLTA